MDATQAGETVLDPSNSLVLPGRNPPVSEPATDQGKVPNSASNPLSTPQKSMNKKKLKVNSGAAVDTVEGGTSMESLGEKKEDLNRELLSTKDGAVSPSPGSADPSVGSVRAQ